MPSLTLDARNAVIHPDGTVVADVAVRVADAPIVVLPNLRLDDTAAATVAAALAARLDGQAPSEATVAEAVQQLREQARTPAKADRDGADDETTETVDETARRSRPSQADVLVALVEAEGVALIHDPFGAAFAVVGGTPIPLTDRNGAGGDWLRRLYWRAEGKPARAEAVSQALDTLRARARFEGTERDLYVRAAWVDHVLYFELRPGRVVRVTPGSWDFDPAPPVLFRHYPNARPLPDPDPVPAPAPAPGPVPQAALGLGVVDANVLSVWDTLSTLVNVRSDRDRRLLTAAVAVAPLPHIARPIIEFTGPQGAGKTFGQRVIKRLLDPTAPESIRLDPRDALQKAAHAFVLLFDNTGSLPDWAADLLCRLVTGEGDSRRRLYTDDEDVIYELRRMVLINGLSSPSTRADLQDRVLPLELSRLSDEERREETELWECFERERPRLLGALFTTLAAAMRCYPSVRLSRLPRLADWGRWAAAVYEALGWGVGQFVADWTGAERRQHEVALDGSLVAQGVLTLMRNRERWRGSIATLYTDLEAVAEGLRLHPERNPAWPKSPSVLSRRLREIEPILGTYGIHVARTRTERGAEVVIHRDDRRGQGSGNAVSAVSRVSAGSNGPDRADGTDGMGGAASRMPSGPSAMEAVGAPRGELDDRTPDGTDGTDGIFATFSAAASDDPSDDDRCSAAGCGRPIDAFDADGRGRCFVHLSLPGIPDGEGEGGEGGEFDAVGEGVDGDDLPF